MNGGPLICDTGALVDYVVESSSDHDAFREAIELARARYIPGLVLAEVDYFLRGHREAMSVLVEDIRRGAFIYAPPTDDQLVRGMAIDAKYADLQLGLVDATIVALAEELDVVRIATRDVRHFSAVRLSDGRAFALAVIPGGSGTGRGQRHRRS